MYTSSFATLRFALDDKGEEERKNNHIQRAKQENINEQQAKQENNNEQRAKQCCVKKKDQGPASLFYREAEVLFGA